MHKEIHYELITPLGESCVAGNGQTLGKAFFMHGLNGTETENHADHPMEVTAGKNDVATVLRTMMDDR